jgi:hypothetical protein
LLAAASAGAVTRQARRKRKANFIRVCRQLSQIAVAAR